MVNFPGRNDRRRRVLKEEVLSASNIHAAQRATAGAVASADSPRYSDAAGVENQAQVTDFIPRHYGTIAVLVLVGAATVAALAALDHFAATIADATGVQATTPFELSAHGSVAAWVSAVVCLLTGVTCLLTYSLRRYRIDDYRGRYRIWLASAAACLLLSANSVVGFHQMVADVLGHFTGWTALRAGAVWWLAVAGLPLAWIIARTLFDLRECRVATVLLMAAVLCYGASMAGYLGLVTVGEPQIQSLLVGASIALGHWLALAAAVAYARFVVLDAQGLIALRHRAATKPASSAVTTKKPAEARPKPASASSAAVSTVAFTRQPPQPAKTPAEPSRWVDGSRPERDRYDRDDDDESSDDDGKLSKSERKRLRKLKAQQRVA